ncbi:MAG: ABC transporter ATP-binding protein [Saccharofermentanales bacterium]
MDYVVEMLGITKAFPGVLANDNITLQLKKGEIHALLGENGAGKSTLMSILFGLIKPDSGRILINGQEVKINNPNDANNLGIGMVHQHFKLVHNFTVLENIILGNETLKRGLLNMDSARERVMEISDRYGLKVNPDEYISDITVGMQQRVEILKMLYRENEILIFDEPTAVLTPQEIIDLMKIMKSLVEKGKTIVFITHKLKEIMAIGDRCTVLRKGKYCCTVEVASTTVEELSEVMVGRKIEFLVVKEFCRVGDPILQVHNLVVKSKTSHKDLINDISFIVRKGEIVCIAGVDGNGQRELVFALCGLMRADGGEILLNGKNITHENIRRRSLDGISHIPDDRHKYGLILDYNLAENLILQTYFTKRFQKNGFLKFKDIENYSNDLIRKYDIRAGQGAGTNMRSMSGGNQQKAIIAREIDKDPQLLIAVQPTRGLDVGAVETISQHLIAQRDAGKGVLLISLELDEVMNVSDRILVIYEGEIVANVLPNEITVMELGLYMSGSKKQEKSQIFGKKEEVG